MAATSRALTDLDEVLHDVGAPSNWNECRQVDFWDGFLEWRVRDLLDQADRHLRAIGA